MEEREYFLHQKENLTIILENKADKSKLNSRQILSTICLNLIHEIYENYRQDLRKITVYEPDNIQQKHLQIAIISHFYFGKNGHTLETRLASSPLSVCVFVCAHNTHNGVNTQQQPQSGLVFTD